MIPGVTPEWVKTREMASMLGVTRNTLVEWKRVGYMLEGDHWRKANPLSPRSDLLWHRERVKEKVGAY